MQACVESGHFFTVRIYFFEKIFLENQFRKSKKNICFQHSFQIQTQQGFLCSYPSQVLILAGIFGDDAVKPL